MTKTQTRVVILGAGFGGLTVARLLLRNPLRENLAITIIDKETESTYTPWLHEVAAGTVHASALSDADIPLESIRGVRYRRGVIRSIDRVTRHVFLEDGSSIPFDILVCALGSVSNDFGIPGVRAFGLDVKRTPDALRIRSRIASMLRAAPTEKKQRVFVIGTGANGVEFAAECASMIQRMVRRGVLKKQSCTVHLVGATPDILTMLPQSLRHQARQKLEKLGIVFHLSASLTEMKEGTLTLQPLVDGLPKGVAQHESFDACVVALGVKVPDVVRSLGFAQNERGRILVDDTLRVRGESAMFALGDSAVREHGTPDPQTAQAAVRQAHTVARNIAALVHQSPLKAYRPHKRWPIVITLGLGYAVGTLWGMPIWGYTVAILRRVIDARYFSLVTSWRDAFVRMSRGFLTYAKDDCTKDHDMESR